MNTNNFYVKEKKSKNTEHIYSMLQTNEENFRSIPNDKGKQNVNLL